MNIFGGEAPIVQGSLPGNVHIHILLRRRDFQKHHQKTNITWENYLCGVRSFVQKTLPSDGPPALEVRARFSVPHITFPLLLVKYIFFQGNISIASPRSYPGQSE